LEAIMISTMHNGRRKGIILGAAAIASLCVCAAKPADAYGWHGGWHGGWGWAGPRIGIGFGYYPGLYAYAPPTVYYAPPVYYGPPAYYAPAALAVAPPHKTVHHHVHRTTTRQTCPVPQSGGTPSNATAQSDY
jgi:hypothetical protein